MLQANSAVFGTTAPAASAVLVGGPEELVAIHEPGINLCIWRRALPEEVERFVDTSVLPRDIKRLVTCSAADPAIDDLLQDLPAEPGLAVLRDDMRELARHCARLTGARQLTLKLESFGSNLCERFHVDRVPLRLLCSYAGPGTQWLDSSDVNRAFLGPAAGGLADEDSGLLRLGAAIQHMERFTVALMKGECWPGNSGNGLVHRSPRIASSGQRRVLFKIDPATPAEC